MAAHKEIITVERDITCRICSSHNVNKDGFYNDTLTSPKVIITDKLGQYNKAFNHVFYSNLKENRVIHLKSEGFEVE